MTKDAIALIELLTVLGVPRQASHMTFLRGQERHASQGSQNHCDFRESKITKLIEKLQQNFEVYYNTGLTLITIKNYDEATFENYRKMKGVLLEQSSRSTLQVLVKG